MDSDGEKVVCTIKMEQSTKDSSKTTSDMAKGLYCSTEYLSTRDYGKQIRCMEKDTLSL